MEGNWPLLSDLLFSQDREGKKFLRLALQVDELDPEEGQTVESCWHPGLEEMNAGLPKDDVSYVGLYGQLGAFIEAVGGDSRRNRVLQARAQGLKTRLTVLDALLRKETPISMAEEWRQIYGHPMAWQDTSDAAEARQEIAKATPQRFAADTLFEGIANWRDSLRVPDLIGDTATFRQVNRLLIAETRNRLAHLVGKTTLPPTQLLKLEFPLDPAYDGQLRFYGASAIFRIARHTKAPPILANLLNLVPHELIHLVQGWNWFRMACRNGWSEMTIWMPYDPTFALLEGLAGLGQELLFSHEEAVAFAADLYNFADVEVDHAELDAFMQLRALLERLLPVRDNAVLMIDQGKSRENIDRLLVQEALIDPNRVESFHQFIADLRSYIWLYHYSLIFYREWIKKQPDKGDAVLRLFTELLIPQEIELEAKNAS